MPTNLALNDALIEAARRIGRHWTKKDAVNAALDEYVKRRKQVRILEAFGEFEFDCTYNYKRNGVARPVPNADLKLYVGPG